MVTKDKVRIIFKDKDDKVVSSFKTKTATKDFAKMAQGTELKVLIDEGKEFAEQFVGDYVIKGLPEGPIIIPPVDPNKPPVVNAGQDVTIKQGLLVTLDGATTDLDGTIERVAWTQIAGPTVELTADPADFTNATFTAPNVPADVNSQTFEFLLEAFDDKGAKGMDKMKVTVVKDVIVPPVEPPVEPPTSGTLIWGSDRDGHLHNKVKRTITDREGTIHINASGNPVLKVNEDGTFSLVCSSIGHGRWYFTAPNYDCVLERKARMLSITVDNDSTKVNSRHQYRDEIDPQGTDEETQGGLGNAWHRNEVDQKIEVVHGGASACPKTETITIKGSDWYRTRFTVKHDDAKKEISQISELEYPIGSGFKKVLEQNCTAAPDQFFNKAQIMEWSETWNRLNGKGEINYEYVNLYAL